MSEGIIQEEAARALGVSAERVSALKRKGRLRRTKHGKVDLKATLETEQAVLALAEKRKAIYQRQSYARKEKDRYQAKLLKLDYEKKSGLLIEKAKVAREAFEVGRRVRDILSSIPDRLAGLVSAESDQARNHALLTTEIAQACQEIAQWCGEMK